MFPIHGQVMFKLCMLTSLRTNALRKFNHMRWKSEIFYTSEHFLKRNIWSTLISLNSRSTLWNPMIAFSNTVISSSAGETEPLWSKAHVFAGATSRLLRVWGTHDDTLSAGPSEAMASVASSTPPSLPICFQLLSPRKSNNQAHLRFKRL